MAIVFTKHEPGPYRSVRMRAASAVTKGHAVKTGTNGVDPAGDGDPMLGIAGSTEDAGDDVLVYFEKKRWKAQLATGFNPDMGDLVALASSSEVDGGTTGDPSCGVVVEKDPASGGEAIILLTPSEAESQTI